jgi:hypothetical protein
MPVLITTLNANILSLLGLLALLAVLAFVASYLLGKLRPQANDTSADTHSMWSSFRELRQRGELTDEEYGRIRQALSTNLKTELDQRDQLKKAASAERANQLADRDNKGGRPLSPESDNADDET